MEDGLLGHPLEGLKSGWIPTLGTLYIHHSAGLLFGGGFTTGRASGADKWV